MPTFDPADKQGGKAYGQFMAQWESSYDAINKEFEEDEAYSDDKELPEKLQQYKSKSLMMTAPLNNLLFIYSHIRFLCVEFRLLSPERARGHKKFIECDRDKSGDLNLIDVKYMLEKLGQAKTHVEVKKMIKEVDSTDTGVINYRDFVRMMLGSSGVLRKILLFEAFAKPAEKPKGVPPKRDLSSLP